MAETEPKRVQKYVAASTIKLSLKELKREPASDNATYYAVYFGSVCLGFASTEGDETAVCTKHHGSDADGKKFTGPRPEARMDLALSWLINRLNAQTVELCK